MFLEDRIVDRPPGTYECLMTGKILEHGTIGIKICAQHSEITSDERGRFDASL